MEHFAPLRSFADASRVKMMDSKEARRAAIVALAAAAFGVSLASCGASANNGAASATPVSPSGSSEPKVEKEPRGDSHCGGH
jgi:hypothetical protein